MANHILHCRVVHILAYEHTFALLYIRFDCYPPYCTFDPCFAVDICTSILPAPRSGTGMLNLLASSLWRLVALINVSQSFRAIALCHSVTKIQSGETVYCNFV